LNKHPTAAITRRTGLLGALTALAAPALITRRSLAATTEITVADNGGPVGASFREAFYDPFEKATGIKVINITQNVDPVAQFRVMVEAKAYTSDVSLLTPGFVYRLTHPKSYLETLDLTGVDTSTMLPHMVMPTFVGTDVWTTTFAYRTDKFADKGPASWSDFWNVDQFPGRRGLQQSPMVNLEIALMADGVPPDKIYPIDADRAFKVLDRIKPHVNVWWSSGAQSTQLLQSAEVDLLSIWSARAQTTIDAGTPAKIVWNGNIASVDGWSIPKGCPRLDAVQQFVRFCIAPDRQAAYTPTMKNGPTNSKAYESIPADRAALLPTSPANRKVMLVRDDEWWGANFATMKQRFDAWLLET
jgi:putative spermidine/putrescine transport system substrate-binding protein